MDDHHFKPTLRMAANAKHGLELRKKFGRGGTSVGVRRAHQLADRDAVSSQDVVAIASYFARHAVDKDAASTEWGDAKDPSAGYIAWLLWGGEEGKIWAERKRALVKRRAGGD
jgi:hypothetical protein